MIDLRNKVEEAMKRLGQNLRVAREASHRSQEEVASAAKIGRSTLVHIESGKGASLSKIMAIANVLSAEVGLSNGDAALTARRLARLEQGAKVQSIREAHLRLAVRMLGDAAAGKLLVEDARKTVSLWRANQTCSPFYIESWEKLLAGSARDIGRSLGAMDERWSNALLQNTPFSHALFADRVDAADLAKVAP